MEKPNHPYAAILTG